MINKSGFKENLYTPGCIRTVSGQYVNIKDPNPDTLLISDIAHALAMIPRFGGHLPIFYSVAEHCIRCVEQAAKIKAEKREYRHIGDYEFFTLLMHDSSEAFGLMDLQSPVKRRLAEYYRIEGKFMRVLAKKFGFSYPFTDFIKKIDKEVLELEWDEIMLRGSLPEGEKYGKYQHGKIIEEKQYHYSHSKVKNQFINLFNSLNPNATYLNAI